MHCKIIIKNIINLIIIFAFLILFFYIPKNYIYYTTKASALSQTEEVVRLVNIERTKRGLAPLKISPVLSENAATRAKEISYCFSHERPDGSASYTALDANIKKVATSWGENISCGTSGWFDAEQTVNSWMNSSQHKENILRSTFTHIGVGCYESGGKTYWVQMFVGTKNNLAGSYIPGASNNSSSSSSSSSANQNKNALPATVISRAACGFGDANRDGKIDASDATLILIDYATRLSNGYSRLANYTMTANYNGGVYGGSIADIDGDGMINSSDATCVLILYAENLQK